MNIDDIVKRFLDGLMPFEGYLPYLLVPIAAALMFVGIKGMLTYLRAKHWTPVTAEIISLSEGYKEVVIAYSSFKHYFPVVQYRYVFAGKQYFSGRASLHIQDIWVCEVDGWGRATSDEKKIWHKWRVNEPIQVFVDPRKPQRSVIERGMPKVRRSHYLALIVSGILCLGFFVVIIIATRPGTPILG